MNKTHITQERIIYAWLFLLGASLSLSLAIANILVAFGFIYVLSKHGDFILEQFKQPYIQYILFTIFTFQCIEFIHDGLFLSKASKVFMTFSMLLILGNYLRTLKITSFPHLFAGLMIGLILGTTLNQYFNPSYPLWATYSMTYANQAAGLAITTGLLSLVTKRWWIITPSLLAMLLYIYMTGERASIVALVCAIAVLLIFARKHKILIGLAMLTALAASMFSTSSSSIQQQYEHNVRFDIWHHAILITQKDRFLGRGEKHQLSQSELDLYKTYASGAGLQHLQHVVPSQPTAAYNMLYHNQFLQYLVEYGVIGLAFFLLFFLLPLRYIWQQNTPDYHALIFAMIWISFAIHCIFETSFDSHSAIILGLLAGLMLPLPTRHSNQEKKY